MLPPDLPGSVSKDQTGRGSDEPAPSKERMVEQRWPILPDGITKGSLLLAGTHLDTLTDIEWPHRLFLEYGKPISVTSISLDGRYVAFCFQDQTITIWSLQRDALAHRLVSSIGGEDIISSMAWSHDNTKLIYGGSSGNIGVWEVESMTGSSGETTSLAHIPIGHQTEVQVIATSPDGLKAVTSSADSSVKLWKMETYVEYGTFNLDGMVVCATFSPDSQRLAVTADSVVWIYRADSSERLLRLQGHDDMIWSLEFSSDNERILTCSEDGTARVWETDTGAELISVEHSGPIWSAKFSPDNKEILTGSYDSCVAVRSSYTGESRLQLNDRPSPVHAVAYTPDGEYIAAGCADGTVKIWENVGGKFICEIRGHKDKVNSLEFTPDGRKFVTSGDDGTMRIWDLVDILRIS